MDVILSWSPLAHQLAGGFTKITIFALFQSHNCSGTVCVSGLTLPQSSAGAASRAGSFPQDFENSKNFFVCLSPSPILGFLSSQGRQSLPLRQSTGFSRDGRACTERKKKGRKGKGMEYFSAKGTCLLQRIKCCQMSLTTLLINLWRHLSCFFFLFLCRKNL